MSDYRLTELGWVQFEFLCQSLLKAAFAVGIESWGGTSDRGRDAYYEGRLPIPDNNSAAIVQSYQFQAKFTTQVESTAFLSQIRREATKLAGRGPDCYVLMTNLQVTASLRTEVRSVLQKSMPNTTIVVWGGKDLGDLLDQYPAIRTAFPQLLGLRDLSALLRAETLRPQMARSQFLIRRAQEDSRAFVPVASYKECVSVLETHSMALLAGPPEMGKTTIARVIGLAQHTQGWDLFDCRTPNDFHTLYDESHPQVFIADDAFGSTEYSPTKASAWADDLESIASQLDDRHWIIWTSRPTPLEAALKEMHLQGDVRDFPEPARLIVNAANLPIIDKALILYRHAKNSELPSRSKELIRRFAKELVESRHFTPKRMQLLVESWIPDKQFMSDVDALKAAVFALVETPTDDMRKSFSTLPKSHKRLLVSLLDDDGNISAAYDRHVDISEQPSIESIASDLADHFIYVDRQYEKIGTAGLIAAIDGDLSERTTLSWIHPSWRDVVIDYVSSAPAERTAFLSRCGRPGLELALSIGGGAEGNRKQPLLVTDNDWHLLESRIGEIVRTASSSDTPAILALFLDAARSWRDSPREEAVLTWCHIALNEVRQRWDRSLSAIPTSELRSFFLLSELLRPLPSMPDLEQTWNTAAKAAALECTPDSRKLAKSAAWIELAVLILRNEPRFLRQVAITDHYSGLAESILAGLVEMCAPERLAQIENSNVARRYLEFALGLALLFPETQSQAGKVAASLQRIVSRLQDAKSKRLASKQLSFEALLRNPLESGLSIDDIFSDL